MTLILIRCEVRTCLKRITADTLLVLKSFIIHYIALRTCQLELNLRENMSDIRCVGYNGYIIQKVRKVV